jgi:hypothetical protein
MTSTLFDIKATATKRQRLEQLEIIIKDSYYRQGEAFKEIRDARLYLLDYESFDAYCKAEWGHNRAWADRLIAAASLAGDIKRVDPNGSIPKNESQARALRKLAPDVQKAVLAEVSANNSNMTAKEIQKAAEKYKKPDPNGIQAESIKLGESSGENLACFQELCLELSDVKRTDTYIRDWLDDLWIKVNNLPESLEISNIKFQLKMLFYENEWLTSQADMEEFRLANNPWGFLVR